MNADEGLLKRSVLCLLGVIPFLYFLYQSYLYFPYINDDAYITFRYSWNLSQGLGAVFNLGEWVEGYSNPFWMGVMAILLKFGGSPMMIPFIAKGLGLVFNLGQVILAIILAFKIGDRLKINRHLRLFNCFLVMISLFLNPSFILNGLSGLETAQYGFFVLFFVYLWLFPLKSIWKKALIVAILLLSRPEAIAIIFIYITYLTLLWVYQKKEARELVSVPKNVGFEMFTILFIIFLILGIRYIYYGEWVPNTYFAKEGGTWVDPFSYVYQGALSQFGGWIIWLLALLGCLKIFKVKNISYEHFVFMLNIICFGMLFPIVFGADWMIGYRFLVPYYPLFSIFISLGIVMIFRESFQKSILLLPLSILVMVYLFFYHHEEKLHYYKEIKSSLIRYKRGHFALIDWLKSHEVKENSSIALVDIGIVGYHLPHFNIIDLAGLTDKKIAKSEGILMSKAYSPRYITDKEPDYILLTLTKFKCDGNILEYKVWSDIERRVHEEEAFQENYMVQNDQDLILSAIGAVEHFDYHDDYRMFLFKRKKF